MKLPISARLLQEISGYITGLLLIVFIIGVLLGTTSLQLQGRAQSVVNIMAISLILIAAYMVRSSIVHQPSKSYAHIAQIFSDEHNPWEIHGVVKKIISIDDKDPLYLDSMKPFNLTNQYAYAVEYSNVTVIGETPFEFKNALFFADVGRAELESGKEHEILYKGFPAPVLSIFLVLDLLRVHKIEAVEDVRGEEYVPVFYVRHAPYHSQYEKKFQALPQAQIEMLNSENLAGMVSLISVQDKVIEREERAREDGVRMGEDLGAAAIRRYKRVGDKSLSLPNLRSHRKAYGVLAVAVLMLTLGYFMGWVRI